MDAGNDARRCDEDQLAQPSWAKDCGMISDEKRRSAVDELLLAATAAYRHVNALDVIANAVGVDISGEGLHDAEEMVYGALVDLIDRPTCHIDFDKVHLDHVCSRCGERFWHSYYGIPCSRGFKDFRFCPNCGAEVING